MAKGHKKSEPENLPGCAVEYIKQVIRKMRYRRKVRADVQAELTAHFEDELSRCQSDQEKEEKAEQLIAGFGDAKLLAVLLRRAKKRCRPLWQTIFARACHAVVLSFICFVIYVAWFLSGKPSVTTNYVAQLNRLVQPTADESLNAAPLYEKAIERYTELPDDISAFSGTRYTELAPEQKRTVGKWLKEEKEVFDLLIAATQKPYYWRRYHSNASDNSAMGVLITPPAEFRRLAFALQWRAQLRAEQGHYQDAFDDIKVCYRLGHHLRGDGVLVEQLVGIAIEALSLKSLRFILREYDIDSVALAKMQHDFEQMIPDHDFVVSLKAEKLFMYDEIQRCFTEDRIGGGHLYLKRFNQLAHMGPTLLELMFEKKHWTVPLHVLFTHPNKQQTKDSVDRFFAFWESMARKSPVRIRAEQINIEEKTDKMIKGNIFLQTLAPALGRISRQAYASKAGVEATLTIIAILRYGQDVGGYPENFDKLIETGYLKQLPIDPYSDKPLVYRRTEDGFVLYSVGGNFEDDGGVSGKDSKGRARMWADEGDWVFWPPPKSRLKK